LPSNTVIFTGNVRFDHYRLALAFATLCQPSGQPFGKAVRRNPKARFHFPVADRQRVVKLRGVREVTHTELIEPFQRARAALSANHDIHQKPLRVHGISLSSAHTGVRKGSATRSAWLIAGSRPEARASI
jgi:hypothetical protein